MNTTDRNVFRGAGQRDDTPEPAGIRKDIMMRDTSYYRAAVARMGRCCAHINAEAASRPRRPELDNMASRVVAAYADDPAAALAVELAGADALGTLLRMRAAASDPRLAPLLRGAR